MAEHTTAAHTSRLTELRRLDFRGQGPPSPGRPGRHDQRRRTPHGRSPGRRAESAGGSSTTTPNFAAEAERRSAQAADRRAGAITAGAHLTAASLRADLANARAANHRQHTELAGRTPPPRPVPRPPSTRRPRRHPRHQPDRSPRRTTRHDPVRDERRTRTMPTRTRRRPPDQPRTHRPHQPGTLLTTIHTRPTSTTQPAVAHTCARHKPAGHKPCRTPHTPEKATSTPASTDVYLHADMSIKQAAIDRTRPPHIPAGTYTPPPDILTWLDSL